MTDIDPPFQSSAVQARFASYPEPARAGLLRLRGLIFETAAATPEVGPLSEELKWGQPAYLTPATKSGSTIRLDAGRTGGFALYAHCRTSIISGFRDLFPEDFAYEGNRAVHFGDDEVLPLAKLRLLVHSALTYHLKRS